MKITEKIQTHQLQQCKTPIKVSISRIHIKGKGLLSELLQAFIIISFFEMRLAMYFSKNVKVKIQTFDFF